MAYRLTGNNLKRFDELCIAFQRKTGCTIHFESGNKANGYELYSLVQNIYGSYIKRHSYGFTYADFTIRTRNSADGKFIYDDINGAVQEYKQQNGYEFNVDTGNGGGGQKIPENIPEDHKWNEETGLFKSGQSGNMLVGFVGIILIMMLWDR